MIKKINIAVFLMCGICLYNLFSSSGLICGFKCDNKEILKISYDVSLALFAGGLLYLFTSALPIYISNLKLRIIYNKSFEKFVSDSIRRLKSIEKVDFSLSPEQCKDNFSKLKYGARVQNKQGSSRSIYQLLISIYEDREKINKDCLPLVISTNDYEIHEKINKLINHRLFNKSRKYLNTEETELKDVNVEIGLYIKQFYDELNKHNAN